MVISQSRNAATLGVLAFCGFDVVEPFLAYAPARKSDSERDAVFRGYADRLMTFDEAPTLPMLRSEDYDHFVRKPLAA